MEEFIFIQDAHNYDDDKPFLAIDKDRAEWLPMSDTYNQYGQLISSSDAGDYLKLLTDKAVKIANDNYNENYSDQEDFDASHCQWDIEDIISAYDYSSQFEFIINHSGLIEGKDYEVTKEDVQGFNYFDGSNYKSVILYNANGEVSHEIVTDKELIQELSEALESKELVSYNKNGTDIYQYGKFDIVFSYWSGAFESYKLSYKP